LKIQVPVETDVACTGSLNIIEGRINGRDFDSIDPQALQGVPSINVYSQPLELPNSMNLATQRPWNLDILWDRGACTVTATAMEKAIDFVQMERLARQTLAGIVALLRDSTLGIKDLELLHSEDDATVRKWNSAVLPVDRGLIHEKIDSTCRSFPQQEAVAAWDISLSYEELQQISSNLAKNLVEIGVGRGQIVAVCMQKGAAVVVALLAVLKAGATILPLATSYPSERLHRICSLAQPKLIIVDDNHGSYLATVGWNVQRVDNAHFDRNTSFWEPIRGECEDIAYVCFTSGSTGTPKGCKISHRGFCTAARALSLAVHYDSNSRVFHWVSFAFDVSLLRIFHTLFVGGTVCMPNENDKMKDLTNALNYFKATHLSITPSASMLISPKDLSSLQYVTLAGETIAPEALALWRDHVHLTNGYGPTECSVLSSQEHDFSKIELGSIGKPTSCRYWVMNRACREKVAPVGALGELLIEGPNVGAGYLNNESETRRSFVHRPESLDKYSIVKYPSYWTGDLVKSMADGSVIFCGRADNQVKIRGQRVELGEIHGAIHDSGLLAGRSAVVDVVYPDDEPQQNYLTLFVEFPATSPEYANSIIAEDSGVIKAEIDALARNVRTKLSRILPLHMVPTVFLPVTAFPKTASGKVDRKVLRRGGGTKTTKRRLLGLPDGPAVSEAENSLLLNIISDVLGINLSSQQLDRSFLSLGGDSLRAIRLVSKLREEGRVITVAEILGKSSLASIKDQLESRPKLSQVERIEQSPMTALSLLEPALNRRNVVEKVAEQCDTTPGNIDDVFPCTPLQESLVLASMRRKHAYWTFQSFRLKHQANSEHVRESWLHLCDAAPLLRTRIVLIDGQKIHQVRLRTPSRFTVLQDGLKQVEEMAWKETEFDLGAELASCSLVQDQYIVVRTHHAVLDGWSLFRTIMSFDQLLSGYESLNHADFRLFVKYCRDVLAEDHCRAWWQNYLSGLPASYSFVEREDGTLTDSMFEFEEGLERPNALEFTLTTYVRTAFGLLIGAYSNTADVIFGTIASGRAAPIPGIATMCGPTICVTPFRVQWNSQSRLEQVLSYVHESTLAMSDVEQVGVESIQSWLLQSEKKTCQLPNLLVVQPDDGFEKGNVLNRLPSNMNMRLLHDLNFELIPVKDSIRIRVRFEQTSIDLSMLARIVRQFHTILQRLLRLDPSCKIAKAFEAPEPERLSMLNTNRSIHALHECCIHDLVDASARKFCTKLAVDAHDGIWSYRELHKESERIATGLALWGVREGSSVICVLERSKWAVATMLAILKQGAHCVALAADNQQKRADRIVAATGAAHFVVAEELLRRLQFQTQNIRTPQQLAEAEGSFQHCVVAPESTAFIMFSSGTTGERESAFHP
jgi:amino acid adenylation domain-containing protein